MEDREDKSAELVVETVAEADVREEDGLLEDVLLLLVWVLEDTLL